MQAEIITIGDEILIGQIVDTNSTFIAKALNKIGISVSQITSIQDDKIHILRALKVAEVNVDIIILTGGLGPTKDDITKLSLCEYFNDELVENKNVLAHIKKLFNTYINQPLLDTNKAQALVPSSAKVLMNLHGTAPGLWFQKNEKVFISLPGVPFEMKALINNEVIPKLKSNYHLPHIVHKTILTYGLGESALADRIKNWEIKLPNTIKLAYLPSLGRVRLRLSSKGFNKVAIENTMATQIAKLLPQIKDVFVAFDEDNSITSIIGKKLTTQNKTLATAESCTGGQIAQTITHQPGASNFFKGSVVSYAASSKIEVLKISEALIKKNSVVSKAVAEAMATQVQKLFKTDYAISTTGNAGPNKGDSDADIGVVWIAIATPKSVYAEKFIFSKLREKNISRATNKAFELLLKEI